jgi:orotate phosphoribosyltransferase
MTNEDILKVFEETEGILKGHFMLTSGRHSDTYMQCAKLFVHPDRARLLCGELAKKMEGERFDLVISPAVGGILMGYQTAAVLGLPNIFFERQDGKMTLRRGFSVPAGAKILAVEDVVTTGGTVKEIIEAAEQSGGAVTAVASVVDRSGGAVDFGRKFYSLLRMEIQSYAPEDCPLCREGVPAYKPGSRGLK